MGKSNTKDLRTMTICLVIILSCSFFIYVNMTRNEFRIYSYEGKITNGTKYLMSFNWNERNPFEPVEIDTVKVIDQKDGYIQYEYAYGSTIIYRSTSEGIFRMIIKPIEP